MRIGINSGKGMKEKPLVSIITVNYNGLEYLKMLFTSLRRVTYSPLEVILVDNASTDESVEYTRRHFPEVVILRNPENYMYARGNNEGIRIARGEILCLLNNDVEVDPGFLEPIVEAFQKDETLAAAQPKILALDQRDYFEYAGAAGGFIDRYGYPFLRGRLFFTTEPDRGQYDQPMDIFWASGAALFLRKSVLPEVGLLDEDFTLHMEEIDLCWRIHLQGYRIRCIPQSRIWHKGGGTLSAENPRKIYWNYRNNIFLLFKNSGGINLVRILLFRLLLDALAAVGELVRGNPGGTLSIIRAYLWNLLHFPLLLRKRREVQKQRKVSEKEIMRYIYPGSIVWEYFLRGHRRFSDLKHVAVLKKLMKE